MAATEAVIKIAELRREVSELKLRQAKEPVLRDVEVFLDQLDGNVSLWQYELNADNPGENSFGDTTIRFRFGYYCISSLTVQITKRTFAQGIMFGLLVSDSAEGAVSRGFASSETDESGCSLTILGKAEVSELDQLFMSLESEGLIIAGDKLQFSFTHDSFAKSYTWKLSQIARSWILKNQPSSDFLK